MNVRHSIFEELSFRVCGGLLQCDLASMCIMSSNILSKLRMHFPKDLIEKDSVTWMLATLTHSHICNLICTPKYRCCNRSIQIIYCSCRLPATLFSMLFPGGDSVRSKFDCGRVQIYCTFGIVKSAVLLTIAVNMTCRYDVQV